MGECDLESTAKLLVDVGRQGSQILEPFMSGGEFREGDRHRISQRPIIMSRMPGMAAHPMLVRL